MEDSQCFDRRIALEDDAAFLALNLFGNIGMSRSNFIGNLNAGYDARLGVCGEILDITLSHFKVLDKFGKGGMGVVCKARDLKLDRFVANKVFPPHLKRPADTKKEYVKFNEMWSEADEGLPQLIDARRSRPAPEIPA
jgi:serine/threonine protein kinase